MRERQPWELVSEQRGEEFQGQGSFPNTARLKKLRVSHRVGVGYHCRLQAQMPYARRCILLLSFLFPQVQGNEGTVTNTD